MRIVRDPEGRPHTNQTGPTPPQSMRDPRFVNVRDNVPDAMIEGDRTWQSGDWRPTCRGYAHLFDHRASLEWIELHEAMRGVPFAILHLQGGHVICAFWSDHNSGLWYTHPVTGELLMDDECYILAADGWSGNVGQPTTLQTDDSRLSKKHIDHLWMCMRPDGYATPSAELACCLAP